MTIVTGMQPTVTQVTQRIDFHTYGEDAPVLMLKPDNYFNSKDRAHTVSRVNVKHVAQAVGDSVQATETVSVYVRLQLKDGGYSDTEKLLRNHEEYDELKAVLDKIMHEARDIVGHPTEENEQ